MIAELEQHSPTRNSAGGPVADASSGGPAELAFTADELRAAMRLLDPALALPDEFYAGAAAAPPDSPWLLPPRVLVALTVVSERFGRAADAWLAAEPPDARAEFERERELLPRVTRGEAPPPGLGT